MGTKNQAASTSKAMDPQPPKGFKRVSIPEIDGWIVPEVGKVIEGKLVGLMRIDKDEDGMRESILIELSKPTGGKDADSKDVRILEVGEIGALGLSTKLLDLKAYVAGQGNVWLYCKSKKSIKHGRTMWVWETYCNGERATPPAAKGDDDDVAF